MDLLNQYIAEEAKRQNDGLELIASENYASAEVRRLCGSILTNKYAEGFPGKRYYGGCENIDKVEQLAIDLACQLFKCKYANVQPHCGSSANMIAYAALLSLGDTILSLGLNEGGHLTHGSPVSFSGKYYKIVNYHLTPDGHLDYDGLAKMAAESKPKLILAGFSAYPYEIDFKRISEIAKANGAFFMVDMAHFAGLVATGYHQSPIPYADIVTSTTHKTLRGPRGGIILTNSDELIKKINSACFPGLQGGPLENIIAAKAQCFYEAMQPSFKEYIQHVVENTEACADEFKKLGCDVGGTETHLFLLNTKKSFGVTGVDAQHRVELINITVNKNMLANDDEKPSVTSGIRIGFAATTTRGMTAEGARETARIIYDFLSGRIDQAAGAARVKKIVASLKNIENI